MWGPETRCPSTYEIIVTKVFKIGYVLSDYSMEVARLLLVKKMTSIFSTDERQCAH